APHFEDRPAPRQLVLVRVQSQEARFRFARGARRNWASVNFRLRFRAGITHRLLNAPFPLSRPGGLGAIAPDIPLAFPVDPRSANRPAPGGSGSPARAGGLLAAAGVPGSWRRVSRAAPPGGGRARARRARRGSPARSFPPSPSRASPPRKGTGR